MGSLVSVKVRFSRLVSASLPPKSAMLRSLSPMMPSTVSSLENATTVPKSAMTSCGIPSLFGLPLSAGVTTSSAKGGLNDATSSPDKGNTSSKNSSRPNWSPVLSSRSVMPGPSPMSPPSNGVLKAPPAACSTAGGAAAGAMTPRSNPSMEATNWSNERIVQGARVSAGGRSVCANTR